MAATDKELFLIFQAMPQWLFLLTGKESPGECEFRSEVIKAMERRTDGVAVPRDPTKAITVLEAQAYDDPAIYCRVVSEMALLQQQHQMRDVQGIILFDDPARDPQTPPWNQIVEAYYLPDLLRDLEAREPDHPLCAVFAPLLQEKELLERQAGRHYHKIRESDLEPAAKELLLKVFISWLGQRFRDQNLEELEMMFLGEVPDMRETTLGKDIIRVVREEAALEAALETARNNLICILEERLGGLDTRTTQKIQQMESIDKLSELIKQSLNAASVDELSW